MKIKSNIIEWRHTHIFGRMRLFILTLDVIDILCLFYSNFGETKILFKVHKHTFTNFQ